MQMLMPARRVPPAPNPFFPHLPALGEADALRAMDIVRSPTLPAFTSAEKKLILEHVGTAAGYLGRDYDMQLTSTLDDLNAGWAVLRSTNFGYDFIIVKESSGRGFFSDAPRMRVYLSHAGHDAFAPCLVQSGVAKTLRTLASAYRAAADAHLP